MTPAPSRLGNVKSISLLASLSRWRTKVRKQIIDGRLPFPPAHFRRSDYKRPSLLWTVPLGICGPLKPWKFDGFLRSACTKAMQSFFESSILREKSWKSCRSLSSMVYLTLKDKKRLHGNLVTCKNLTTARSHTYTPDACAVPSIAVVCTPKHRHALQRKLSDRGPAEIQREDGDRETKPNR